jgi:alpha-galactosidase
MDILLNKELIAIDQDPLGEQARPISSDGGRTVLARSLSNGDKALALYNPTDSPAELSTTAQALGLAGATAYGLRDTWTHTSTQTRGTIRAWVPAHGTAIYRVSRSADVGRFAPATSLSGGAPLAYPGAPAAIVRAGQPTTMTTVLSNDAQVPLLAAAVTLSAPPGWSISPASPPIAGAVAGGTAFSTQWTVQPPAAAATGTYQLTAADVYLWGAGTWSSASVTFSVVVPNPPPTGTRYLSDLSWTTATNFWGPVEKDMSNGERAAGDGHPITIGGVVYAKGLGTHAASEIVYYVGGNCSRVSTDVGIDDEKTANGNATFQVLADGRVAADSGPVTVNDAAKHLDADVTGAQFVRLITVDNGSTDSDHTDWAGAQIACD